MEIAFGFFMLFVLVIGGFWWELRKCKKAELPDIDQAEEEDGENIHVHLGRS